jgi:hypothetical protein
MLRQPMAAFHVPRLAAALLAAVAVLTLPTAVAAGGPGAGTPAGARDADTPHRFVLDLAKDDDYVRQSNFVQCVGASVQMMLNIAEPGADRSRRTQRRLQNLARTLSGPRPDGSVRQGAGVIGWAAALNRTAAAPYAVVAADTLQDAMRIAAQAIVTYRRPVGLLVWRGRHAWVMSGFESTRDPRDGSFRVTRAFILDPLHPHGSRQWGPSPKPGTSISVAAVGRQFVRRRNHSRWNQLPGMAELAGKYVLVVPTGPQPATAALAMPPWEAQAQTSRTEGPFAIHPRVQTPLRLQIR